MQMQGMMGYGMGLPLYASPLLMPRTDIHDIHAMFTMQAAKAQQAMLMEAMMDARAIAQAQETQVMLAQAMAAVAEKPREKPLFVNEPAATLPPGMTLRLAAAGIGLPQNRTQTANNLKTRKAMGRAAPKDISPPDIATHMAAAHSKFQKDHNSLRNYLEEDLHNVDKRCVLTARRINKLGFKSKDFLEQHFSKYGEVVEVFVTHPRSKPNFTNAPPKIRPGNFGIVVMKSPEAAQRILAEGIEHTVRHVQIRVSTFQAKDTKPEASEESGNGSHRTSSPGEQSGGQPSTSGGSGGGGSGGEQGGEDEDPSTPKKVALHADRDDRAGFRAEGSKWNGDQRDLAECLRKEADRLRAEAEAMMAAAQGTAALPLMPTGPPAAVNRLPSEAAGLKHSIPANLPSQPLVQQPTFLGMPTAQPLSTPPGLEDFGPEAAPVDSSCNGTLSSHLMEVSEGDPTCVFVVRQIHKLGFQSREKLRQHYSQYGKVLRVLVADKRVKAFPSTNGQRKTRPGGLGMIVMQSAASVNKVLAAGAEQLVGGYSILIQPYEGPKTNSLIIDDASTHASSTQGFESRQSSEESKFSMRDTDGNSSGHSVVFMDVPGF